MNKFDIDEQIECAVREKAAKAHLVELEKSIVRRQRVLLRTISVAASLLLLICIGLDVKLNADIRTAGYAFNPVEGQSGGSEITALMENREIKTALAKISEARELVKEEMSNPSSDDEDYMIQLQTDSEELDFLEAVCYMRQGKYFKAKRHLKAIVADGGYFSYEAGKLLKAL